LAVDGPLQPLVSPDQPFAIECLGLSLDSAAGRVESRMLLRPLFAARGRSGRLHRQAPKHAGPRSTSLLLSRRRSSSWPLPATSRWNELSEPVFWLRPLPVPDPSSLAGCQQKPRRRREWDRASRHFRQIASTGLPPRNFRSRVVNGIIKDKFAVMPGESPGPCVYLSI